MTPARASKTALVSAAAAKQRALHRGHFAFMRAVIQGIDARQAWSRYMQGEDDRVDERLIRRAINTYRDELAAAARRHARPGTARLVLMDASDLPDADAARPTLEEFALERGLEDFSLEDQLAAFEEAWGTEADGHRRQSKRRRLVDRQLEALSWLEGLASRAPRPDDPVEDWLAPALAQRISAAGMPTLRSVAERIQAVGMRWWAAVPAVGPTKAARIVEWFRVHQQETGLVLGPHAFAPISRLGPGALGPVVPAATALRPLEKFVVPEPLRGSSGRFRAPSSQCRIPASDDLEALHIWLRGRGRRSAAGEATAPAEETRRAYRKEAERLLLWAVLERGKALSSLDEEDCAAFIAFVRSPPAGWCGPRHHERWSPLWRPFEGPLQGAALQRCIAVLRGLFRFLHGCGYLTHDLSTSLRGDFGSRAPGSSIVPAERAVAPDVDPSSLPAPATPGMVRARRVAAWLQETEVKPGALARGRCADLVPPAPTGAADAPWGLRVQGERRGRREASQQEGMLAVPATLVAQLQSLLGALGRPTDPGDPANADLPLILDVRDGRVSGLSRGGIYKAIKRLLHHCSIGMAEPQRQALRAASPQRLRRRRRKASAMNTSGATADHLRPSAPPKPSAC